MKVVRRNKLIKLLLAIAVLGLAAALVLYALRQNINLFYTPSDIALHKAPVHRLIRIGGMVEKGSLMRGQAGLRLQFKITDYAQTVLVHYTGILPDLFHEGQGVVVEGEVLPNQHFQAVRVLAKHDENYMPSEVKAALAQQHRHARGAV